jgi:hypothetical protein
MIMAFAAIRHLDASGDIEEMMATTEKEKAKRKKRTVEEANLAWQRQHDLKELYRKRNSSGKNKRAAEEAANNKWFEEMNSEKSAAGFASARLSKAETLHGANRSRDKAY